MVFEQLEKHSKLFRQRHDTLNRDGLNPLVRFAACLRVLVSGNSIRSIAYDYSMGADTLSRSFKAFIHLVPGLFSETFLSSPTKADLERLNKAHMIVYGLPDLSAMNTHFIRDNYPLPLFVG